MLRCKPIFHPVESAVVGLVVRDVQVVEDAIALQVVIGKQDLFVWDVNREKNLLAKIAGRCRAGTIRRHIYPESQS